MKASTAAAQASAWILFLGLALATPGLARALGPAAVAAKAPWSDPGWLPEGWVARETTALGVSGVGTIPSFEGRAEGRVVLAAETESGDGALFLAEIDAPLEVNSGTKEALLLSAPEALRHLWGVDVEVRWADIVQLEGEPTLQLQGRLRRGGKKRHLRLALLPQGPRHLLLVLTWPEHDASALAVEAERVLLALPRPDPPHGPRHFWTPTAIAGTVAGTLLTAIFFFAYTRRRR